MTEWAICLADKFCIDAGCESVGHKENNCRFLRELSAVAVPKEDYDKVVKERDEYKWMYEGLCKTKKTEVCVWDSESSRSIHDWYRPACSTSYTRGIYSFDYKYCPYCGRRIREAKNDNAR